MKENINFSVKDLGFIRSGNISLNDLTIVCGGNNSGKSYLAYIIYGLLRNFFNLIELPIESSKALLNSWEEKKFVEINVKEYLGKINIKKVGEKFSKRLDDYFSTTEYFNNSSVDIDMKPSLRNEKYEGKIEVRGIAVEYELDYKNEIIKIWTKDEAEFPEQLVLKVIILPIIYDYFFNITKNRPFIISSERTGISLFYKELDFTKNQLIELIKQEKTEKLDILGFLMNKSSSYAEPIKDNINTMRDYENLKKKKSFIAKKAEEKDEKCLNVLNLLTNVLDGSFKVGKNKEIGYVPKKTKGISVPLHITASATKSLLLLDLYVRNLAKEGDILVIDEPELHLSIENQRQMAGLIVGLTNIGLKCLITTHSDFLIREINNRIMLKKDFENKELFLKKNKILDVELIELEKVSAFEITEQGIIEEKTKNDYGLEVDFFENKIKKANDLLLKIIEKF
jgi:predicted ATPase